MELGRLLKILHNSDKMVIRHSRHPYRILTNLLVGLLILLVLGFILNITDHRDINAIIFSASILIFVPIFIRPDIIIRVIQAGVIVGIANPQQDFFDGGKSLLTAYARCVKNILFYFSCLFGTLTLIPLQQQWKLVGVLLFLILILALWPKENK